MIDTSTQTPTLPAIFKCLYLHNVWCLHQHKPHSGASTEAVLVGPGKSLGKGWILPALPAPGLSCIFYLFIHGCAEQSPRLPRVSWAGWKFHPPLSLCLSHSFKCELTEKNSLDRTFCWGKIYSEESLRAVQVIHAWSWENFLNSWRNALKHIHTTEMFCCRDGVSGHQKCNSQLQPGAPARDVQSKPCSAESSHRSCGIPAFPQGSLSTEDKEFPAAASQMYSPGTCRGSINAGKNPGRTITCWYIWL